MSSFQSTGTHWRTGTAHGPRAGFSRRFFADAIDLFVVLILAAVTCAVVHGPQELIWLLVGTAYFTFLEGGRGGQTIGKRVADIRVVSTHDEHMPIGYERALLRTAARLPSAIPLYLGYFWMLRSPERQTWHDRIGKAIVVPVNTDPGLSV